MKEDNVPAKDLVIGQKVTTANAQRAREVRRDMTPEETVIWQYDDDRDGVLKARGLRVWRIPNTLVRRSLPAALALILAACQEANTSSHSGTTLGDEALPPSLSGKGPGDRS